MYEPLGLFQHVFYSYVKRMWFSGQSKVVSSNESKYTLHRVLDSKNSYLKLHAIQEIYSYLGVNSMRQNNVGQHGKGYLIILI